MTNLFLRMLRRRVEVKPVAVMAWSDRLAIRIMVNAGQNASDAVVQAALDAYVKNIDEFHNANPEMLFMTEFLAQVPDVTMRQVRRRAVLALGMQE